MVASPALLDVPLALSPQATPVLPAQTPTTLILLTVSHVPPPAPTAFPPLIA